MSRSGTETRLSFPEIRVPLQFLEASNPGPAMIGAPSFRITKPILPVPVARSFSLHRNPLFRFLGLALTLLRISSRNPEALPRLPKSPPKAGERRAGPFAHAADGLSRGLSRPFLAVAVASAANRPFDALSASPTPGRQNLADELDTLAHAKAGP